MGETGVGPVGDEMVAIPLTMPTTETTWNLGNSSKLTMDEKLNIDDSEKESHADKVRSQMDTKDLEAIMGRFFSAVGWRGD